jgi:hypothetical protein
MVERAWPVDKLAREGNGPFGLGAISIKCREGIDL